MKGARGAWLALLMASLAFAGCFGGGPAPVPRAVAPADVGYDPTTVHVLGYRIENATVRSADGTALAARAYVPTLSAHAPPLVLFLHGWGNDKESYEGVQSYPVATPAPDGTNHLRAFAEAGFLAVAYDMRGFGQSGGLAAVAGPAERADFSAVLGWALANFTTNGKVGVIGASYGGGQSFQALLDPRVTTAVPMYGWVDLYQALLTGNVPKLEWAQTLYLYGLGGNGHYDPIVTDWYGQLYTRSDLAKVRAQMADRSTLSALHAVTKPLLICQGMEESLFPQLQQAATAPQGFTRAFVFRGGHGDAAPQCWARAMDWFAFFLQGYDTHVDAWPALETVDSASNDVATYATFPQVAPVGFRLRTGELYQGEASAWAFTIQQSLGANPTEEPAALWDKAGLPNQAIPDPLRQDPTAVTFTTQAVHGGTLVGAPDLKLALDGSSVTPYQVAGTLLVLHADGTSQIVTRSAAAAQSDGDLGHAADGTRLLDLQFHWTKLALKDGDRLVLKLASNDPAWWMPLLANYSVTFTGQSLLELPLA